MKVGTRSKIIFLQKVHLASLVMQFNRWTSKKMVKLQKKKKEFQGCFTRWNVNLFFPHKHLLPPKQGHIRMSKWWDYCSKHFPKRPRKWNKPCSCFPLFLTMGELRQSILWTSQNLLWSRLVAPVIIPHFIIELLL